jgi:ABC-type multidrug transport system fused ATPase/permease subunit
VTLGLRGYATGVRSAAVLRGALRVVFFTSPLLLWVVPGRAGYLLTALTITCAQFIGTASAAVWEQRVQEALYRRVGATLAGASAMVPLPLPDAEPELALGRALWAQSRLETDVFPAIVGEAAALGIALVFVAAAPFRSAFVPILVGIVVAAIVYTPLHRAASRRESVRNDAFTALYAHLVLFLSHRQELIAQGAAPGFVSRLDARNQDHKRSALAAAGARSLVRRIPLAFAILAAFWVADHWQIDLTVEPVRVIVALAVIQGGGALFSAIAERRGLELNAQPLAALLSVPVARLGGDVEPGPCARIDGRGVGFAYGEDAKAVSDLSFTIEPGHPLVLRGENGSGKSTVLRLLAGLSLPQEGSILIDGKDLSTLSLSSYGKHIAFVSQATAFDQSATVKETMLAIDPAISEAALRAALESVGFTDAGECLGRVMGALSSGQRRRVQVARAFALDRRILILDEPEAGLDAASQRRLRDLITRAAEKKIVIVATHSELFDEGLRLSPHAGRPRVSVEAQA